MNNMTLRLEEIYQGNSHYYRAYYKPNGVYLGDIITEIDGFYVFYPDSPRGCFDEYYLKMVLTTLEELNKPYKEILESEET